MKKQTYQTPEMEITRFEAEDIIRTSGDYGTDFMPELESLQVEDDLFYESGLS